jgi:hypothetical protein
VERRENLLGIMECPEQEVCEAEKKRRMVYEETSKDRRNWELAEVSGACLKKN